MANKRGTDLGVNHREVKMTIEDFEDKVQAIRVSHGWAITIECCGIWIITVYDKETGDKLASTGATSLTLIPEILEMPFDKCPWV